MTNRACSTICGVNLLGNSVRGLDFLNWQKVSNALVIPILTYGAQVWYTGISQKGLIQRLQTAQNEGIRKITGTFCTSPVEPLHNMTGIPPLSHVMNKLMHSYFIRLRAMPTHAKVQSIITDDQCRYWPTYVKPPTNLTWALQGLEDSTYRPVDPCTAGLWTHPRLTYICTPSPDITLRYKDSLAHKNRGDVHIIISPTTYNELPVTVYHTYLTKTVIQKGAVRGVDHMQATC